MKKVITTLVSLGFAGALAACGTQSAAPAGQPVTSEEAAASEENASDSDALKPDNSSEADVPTVTMLTFTDWYKTGWEALSDYIDQNSSDLGFKLKIDIIAGGGEGEELIRAKFATGDLPDLLQTYGPKWLDHSAGVLDQIVPLRNVDMSEYNRSQLEEGHYIYDGQLYAVPMDSTSLVGIFYNKDVFKNAGIDKTPENGALT